MGMAGLWEVSNHHWRVWRHGLAIDRRLSESTLSASIYAVPLYEPSRAHAKTSIFPKPTSQDIQQHRVPFQNRRNKERRKGASGEAEAERFAPERVDLSVDGV